MKLPFSENIIIIEDRKLTDYLLNINHSDGSIKAKFFLERRFDRNSLKTILIKQVDEEFVKEIIETEFGTKYIFESEVKSPDNRTFVLRSVWIVFLNAEFIKLITAYPIKYYDEGI